jgi:hypothetical protein
MHRLPQPQSPDSFSLDSSNSSNSLNSLNSSRYSELCPNAQVFLLPVIGLLIT